MADDLFAGPVVDLDTMLAARERRVERRREVFLGRYRPVVSITPVMPGPVKDCRAARALRDAAVETVSSWLDSRRWPTTVVQVSDDPAGPEALLSVAADPVALKREMVALESRHALGRLWDLDVVDPVVGGLSRSVLGLPPRRCFVCDRPARECARSRAHPLRDLLAAIKAMIDDHHDLS